MKYFLKTSVVILGVVFMSNTSCEKETLTGVKTSRFDSPVELLVDEKVTFSKNSKELTLTLVSLSDSRCAKNVQCIWAGNAVAQVQLSGADGSEAELSLCIGECDKVVKTSDTLSVSLNDTNYKVILNEVKNEGINKAVLTVKKI
ncbi:MAG: hypothetical protein ACO1NS_05895 [Daejeonella sp.]